ncbi:MAG: ATP-grasp domain-containing protein [Gemmatimonadota bacterium]
MIQLLLLVDQPYVSDHLRGIIADHRLPLVLTPAARQLGFSNAPHALGEATAVAAARAADGVRVLTSSENALPWVAEHLGFTPLPEIAATFKDKARLRRTLRPRYPDFFFREVAADALDTLDPATLPSPFVIKPSIGFFSVGVHKVHDRRAWPGTLRRIREQLGHGRTQFPRQVVDTTTFLIEECVEGDEFAVDACFDGEGAPVVLGIWAHAFASAAETSDRVYTTSKATVEANLEPVTRWLADLGRLTGARDMAVHVELRRNGEALVPIEVNPLRFGGWCTTADLTHRAFGFSPYVAYLERRAPDWSALLAGKEGLRYSVVVLDNTTGIPGERIRRFDYERLLARFHRPLELRRIDFTRRPLFGFVFLETPDEAAAELDWILRSDLSEFATPTR